MLQRAGRFRAARYFCRWTNCSWLWTRWALTVSPPACGTTQKSAGPLNPVASLHAGLLGPAEERTGVPVGRKQRPVRHLVDAVQPANGTGKILDLAADPQGVYGARLVRRQETDHQQHAVARRVEPVGADRRALEDGRDLGLALGVQEIRGLDLNSQSLRLSFT
jgi:hypothetical protein